MIENVSTQLTCSIVYAHCLLPGRAFASLYVLLFLEKEAVIGGRVKLPTENKRYSDFFWYINLFQDWGQSRLKVPSNAISMSNSLDLDYNQHFASLIRVWTVCKLRFSKTSMQRVQTFHQLNLFWYMTLVNGPFSLNQRRYQTLCISAFANHLLVRHHINNF